MSRRGWGLAIGVGLVVAALLGISVIFVLFQPDEASPGTDGEPGGQGTEVVRLPIEQIDVRIAESFPPQLFVEVSGYVPDSCTTPREPVVTHDGTTITVIIEADHKTGVMCAQIATPYHKNIALGGVQPGVYTVRVNDQTRTVDVR